MCLWYGEEAGGGEYSIRAIKNYVIIFTCETWALAQWLTHGEGGGDPHAVALQGASDARQRGGGLRLGGQRAEGPGGRGRVGDGEVEPEGERAFLLFGFSTGGRGGIGGLAQGLRHR